MFEATLDVADRERTQRLLIASALAIGAMTAALALVWTLERFGIERVGGPRGEPIELATYSVVPPPQRDIPKPPPDDDDDEQTGPSAAGRHAPSPPDSSDDDDDLLDGGDPTSTTIPPIGAGTKPRGSGIPGMSGNGCPAGICGSGPIGPGTGDCVGPHCIARPPAADPAPRQVDFSALSCLACPDPAQAELRRTAASLRKGKGKVQIHFCVDTHGRVEAGSLRIRDSFGDAGVDRVAKAAVARWRFEAMTVNGQPRRTCSVARFEISFQ